MIDSSTIMPHTQGGETPVVADELGHLLAEMSALRVSVIAGAAARLQRYAAGRGEPHVIANLEGHRLLRRAVGVAWKVWRIWRI